MPDNQQSPEIIHRIEPDTSVETAALFDQLVLLLDSGTGEAEGENRAMAAADMAISNPLIDD